MTHPPKFFQIEARYKTECESVNRKITIILEWSQTSVGRGYINHSIY